MDPSALVAAVEELEQLVSGDGAHLRLRRLDADARVLQLELDLSAAGCSDCVLPPDRLAEMVDTNLKRRAPGDYLVAVADPRVADRGRAAAASTPAPQTVLVIDPGAERDSATPDPGPDAGPLLGRTVGFRVDVLWRSWDWAVEEWTAELERRGVRTTSWRRAQGLTGAEGRQQAAQFDTFVESIDVAVVGLGNCGSCTSWTIKDAVAAASAGRPTVAVVTQQFEQLSATLAATYGRPGLRLLALPYPLDVRPEHEVRRIARETLDQLLGRLGAVV